MPQPANLALQRITEARVIALAPAPPTDRPVAPIHTLFPAIHHAHADHSAVGRALALWAATRRAAELAGRAVPRLRSRLRPGRTGARAPAAEALTGPAAVIPVDRFVAYLEEAERAFAADSPVDLLSRIRNTYYSGFLVEQLLPDARARGGRTLHGNPRLGRTAYRHLTARADENGVGDNPAPYLLLPSGEQVDFGHLVLGLDALIHPRTAVPFSAYGVPSIDATGWVADVGMASVWTTKHLEGEPDPRVSRRLAAADRDAYYRMSAPDADLLGDVDVFALRAQWGLAAGQPLSAAIGGYYLGRGRRLPGIRWRRRPHRLGPGLAGGVDPAHRPLQRRLRRRRRRLPAGDPHPARAPDLAGDPLHARPVPGVGGTARGGRAHHLGVVVPSLTRRAGASSSWWSSSPGASSSWSTWWSSSSSSSWCWCWSWWSGRARWWSCSTRSWPARSSTTGSWWSTARWWWCGDWSSAPGWWRWWRPSRSCPWYPARRPWRSARLRPP